MGETTAIAWTDATFNPWIGCSKVHAGCTYCFAEAQNKLRGWTRGSDGQPTWGPGAPRKVTSPSYWKQPLAWAKAAAKAGERRRVFCGSLCDVLDKEAPPEALARLWQLIRATACGSCGNAGWKAARGEPHGPECRGGLDWLILTKRPERWAVIPADVRPLAWLGTSISDQVTADVWVPRLLEAEGFALRFLSIEPLVELVDIERWLWMSGPSSAGPFVDGLGRRRGGSGCGGQMVTSRPTGDIAWVIVGGESGPKARPCDVAWIGSIVQQCRAAGVRCYVKQDSGRNPGEQGRIPADLWAVKEFPEVRT